jgi:hypothetical protein
MEQQWKVKVYRDDSQTTVTYERVKHAFLIGGDSVLSIAQYTDDHGGHRYINWPRERICWWTIERAEEEDFWKKIQELAGEAGWEVVDHQNGSMSLEFNR